MEENQTGVDVDGTESRKCRQRTTSGCTSDTDNKNCRSQNLKTSVSGGRNISAFDKKHD